MNKKEKEEIRKRCCAATPGPWLFVYGDEIIYTKLDDGCRGLPIVRGEYGYSSISMSDWYRNADFISHSRTDISALLDALDEAEAQIEKLKILKSL
jgi:hypothetical protein